MDRGCMEAMHPWERARAMKWRRLGLTRERSARLLPGVDATGNKTRAFQAGVLCRLYRHGRPLAEGAIEHEPLAGCGRQFMQNSAGANLRRQLRVGQVQGARDNAVPFALAFFAQID